MAFETKQFEEYREGDKPKKKEQLKAKNEVVISNEKPIDQQKFIEKKYDKINSVFLMAWSWAKFNEKEPTWWWKLDTERGNVKFHIEKDWWGGKNAEVTVKDWNDTYKIILEYPESSLRYEMSVFKEYKTSWWKKTLTKIAQPMANNKATEYISML